MKGLKLTALAFVLVLLAGVQTAAAQCAQCSAQVETNVRNGGHSLLGLNNGILFLLAMPYLVVATAGYIWYKKYRKKDVNLKQMRTEKLHLN